LPAEDGDLYIDTAAIKIYGPYYGSWPTTGISMVGPAGRTILSGTVAPSNNMSANVGDFYLNTSTWMMYGPYNGTTWPTGVSLKASDSGSAVATPVFYSGSATPASSISPAPIRDGATLIAFPSVSSSGITSSSDSKQFTVPAAGKYSVNYRARLQCSQFDSSSVTTTCRVKAMSSLFPYSIVVESYATTLVCRFPGPLIIDGVTLKYNDTILVDGQVAGLGGIYSVNSPGNSGAPWILWLVTPELTKGTTISVTEGMLGKGLWTVSSEGTNQFAVRPAFATLTSYIYNGLFGASTNAADQKTSELNVTDRGEIVSWSGVLDLQANSAISVGVFANVPSCTINVSNASIAIQKL
jgi:hypothetical protein